MIKLKLNRSEMQVLCTCTNPQMLEKKILGHINAGRLIDLEYLFLLVDIGEQLTKKYFFNLKDKTTISLKWSEASAYLAYMTELEMGNFDAYSINVFRTTKTNIHKCLTGYKQRIYDHTRATAGLLQ